ncbi:sigma-70 family RNA polymerase sigma factor [Halobacillus sp. ACCC02827]|uniref:sigma-70 family RNA polymerase sigma factor n=1 Tax=Halobacillus sp. ACCC02827 TaxID=3052090 RepID=UPI002570DDFB|nr:sigma-70 family RNA polymerase sigma factor [Halobacillus sp. ACCC02827]WJE15145.1 sigma-70 family RNA polymerase sigma factor [Halobacillus sp. ACCC02827]
MKNHRLIKKAKKGDSEAFEKLLIQYSDRLYRTAYLYAGNRDDALDIVQETAYKAFLAIKNLRESKYFLTWITRILINSSYEWKRKKEKELPLEQISQVSTGKDDCIVEHLDLVWALDRLPEKYRDAVVIFYYQDLPIKEVAEIMDVPVNTVKTYLLRGKKQLKVILKGEGYHEGEIIQ